MVITGTLPPIRGLLLFPPQMLGGMVAAGLVSCMFPGTLAVETTLTAGTSIAQGVFIEMFCTAELVFTVLMLAAEKSKATFIAPVGIGLALFVAELAGMCSVNVNYIRNDIRLPIDRCIFHRRLSQSDTLVWPMCGEPELPRISLDILGWAFPGCHYIWRLL